jgi:hypothetical protein
MTPSFRPQDVQLSMVMLFVDALLVRQRREVSFCTADKFSASQSKKTGRFKAQLLYLLWRIRRGAGGI